MPYFGDYLRQIQLPLNIVSSRYRALPDFIIVGAQRSGTTSLYRYLSEHPDVLPAIRKEIHYFDLNYEKGVNWYRRHFPLRRHIDLLSKTRGVNVITGEASPYYLYYPLAPDRIYSTVPDVKIIIMLRNPVDRAYSHYFHEKRLGEERLSFEDAIRNERERLLDNDGYFYHQHYSYLSRGKYVEQVKRYFEVFIRENVLIIESEDFFDDTMTAYSNVLDFLGVEKHSLNDVRAHYSLDYGEMDEGVRAELVEFFRPYNRELYRYLGSCFSWDK